MTTYGFIERDYNGVRAESAKTDAETRTTFRRAIASFGYLVENNEKISLDTWRWRIAKHATPSDRVIAILQSIDKTIEAEELLR